MKLMRSRVLMAGTALSLAGFIPFAEQCAPAPRGHPPTCSVSASRTTAACTFSAEYQTDIGQPVVWTRALCDNTLGGHPLEWKDGESKNLNGGSGDHTTRYYCYPNIVLQMTPEDKPS